MKRDALEKILNETRLFEPIEIKAIMATCGKWTRGNAIIACEILGIELAGSDIGIIIHS